MRREQEAPEEDKEEKTEDRWCWTEAFFFMMEAQVLLPFHLCWARLHSFVV